MRICIVGFGFTRDRKEGVRNYIYGLAEQLSKEGFDILIITIGSSDSVYRINGFKVIEISWTKTLISLISAFNKMRQKMEVILAREKIDVIYDNFVLPGSSLFVTRPLIKRYKKIKFIKEVYNKSLKFSNISKMFFPFEIRYFKGEGIFRLLLNNNIIDRYIYKTADYLICHSSDISQELSDFKHENIKLGIDYKKWAKKIIIKKQKDKFNIAYFGHPSLKKGIRQFLEAAKILLKRKENIFIHIALSKTAEGEKKYVDMSLRLEESFPGRVFLYRETQPLKIFKKADLIVLPLLHDWGAISPPLSLLEAMGAGSIVVCSSFCGVKDIIEDGKNGYLIEKLNSVNLAGRVEDIMLNINSSISKKAQKTAENYDWSKVINSYKNLFKKIAG